MYLKSQVIYKSLVEILPGEEIPIERHDSKFNRVFTEDERNGNN